MATSVKHAVQEEGRTTLETVLGVLVFVLVVGLVVSQWSRIFPPAKAKFVLSPGCPVNAAPADTTQLHACLESLTFDTVAAVGDEQRLLVHDTVPGPACHGDSTHSCRHGPLAKIEPVIGAHERDTTELNEGRIIARLFLRSGETEPYPKLGLVPTDTTYWWIQRQSDTTAVSTYIRISGDSVVATQPQNITIELHPDGTYQQALARFIWDDADEKTQGPCGLGCCH
jgi:hypothetical protein